MSILLVKQETRWLIIIVYRFKMIGIMEDCIFCKIVRGEVPVEFEYQDEEIVVFPDNKPRAPVHLLIVPKKHIEELGELEDKLLLKIRDRIVRIVKEKKLAEKGYRILNNGGAAKGVDHLHFHLLGEISVMREV